MNKLVYDCMDNLGDLSHGWWSNFKQSNKSIISLISRIFIDSYYTNLFEKDFIKDDKSEEENDITDKHLSKLYNHFQECHFYLDFRKYPGYIMLTEFQESSFVDDKNDLKYQHKDNRLETLIWKEALREELINVNKNYTPSVLDSQPLSDVITFKKEMIFDSEGNISEKFLWLMIWLADMPEDIISWNNKDGVLTLSLVNQEKEYDMVMDCLIGEKEALEKIEPK